MVIKTDPLDRLILSNKKKYEKKKKKVKLKMRDFNENYSDLIAKRTLSTEMFSCELWTQQISSKSKGRKLKLSGVLVNNELNCDMLSLCKNTD